MTKKEALEILEEISSYFDKTLKRIDKINNGK